VLRLRVTALTRRATTPRPTDDDSLAKNSIGVITRCVPPRPPVLHAVRDAAVAEHAEAFESKARTSAVADEALATFLIVGFNAHRGLEVETVAFGGERASLPLP
jgi:hypothetical protein